MKSPTTRFSDRVDAYVKYRPGYPRELLGALEEGAGFTRDWIIADIGSGPGNLTRLFLDHGNQVFGVEPNEPMRAAGERLLARYSNFTSLDGMAEATGLGEGAVDLITAGQAFHWFELEPTAREFRRILCPGGWVALIWNERLTDSSEFAEGYESLLRQHSPDYAAVNHADVTDLDVAKSFFAPEPVREFAFSNSQEFDLPAFESRVLSSSYVPQAGPAHEAIMAGVRKLFEARAQKDTVRFEYRTVLFLSQM